MSGQLTGRLSNDFSGPEDSPAPKEPVVSHAFEKASGEIFPRLSGTKLFVIRKKSQPQFWSRSTEHGCGWTDGFPKQAFSKSEMLKELQVLIDEGYWTDVTVCALQMVI